MEVLTLPEASRENEKKNRGRTWFWKEKWAVFVVYLKSDYNSHADKKKKFGVSNQISLSDKKIFRVSNQILSFSYNFSLTGFSSVMFGSLENARRKIVEIIYLNLITNHVFHMEEPYFFSSSILDILFSIFCLVS